jgi:hypothetical protein
MRPESSRWRLATLCACLLSAAGCGLIPNLNGPDGLAIQKFLVSPKQIASGDSATLSWEVMGAESIQVDNGIGVVPAKGSVDLKATQNTTYTLTARSGTSLATASVQILVGPAASGSPSPSPTPSPAPTPTPTPSPSPSPSGATGCGTSVDSVKGCTIHLKRLQALTGGDCIEVTRVALSQGCPMASGTTRTLTFDVTADTQLHDLRWRKAVDSADTLDPNDGQLIRHGLTTASTKQVVQEPSMVIEIISQGTPVLSFTLKNR